jgi:predicted molibdopterin-dependent oxidoreductase YjgC
MGVSSNGGFQSLLRNLIGGGYSGAYVVGEDLLGAEQDQEKIRAALAKLSFLVVQDIRLTETGKLAHVVLPATHFGEKEGTYTNRQGRVQKLNAAVIAPEGALQDCEIFIRLLQATGEKTSYRTPAEIFAALSGEIPEYGGVDYDAIGELGVQLRSGGAKPS